LLIDFNKKKKRKKMKIKKDQILCQVIINNKVIYKIIVKKCKCNKKVIIKNNFLKIHLFQQVLIH